MPDPIRAATKLFLLQTFHALADPGGGGGFDPPPPPPPPPPPLKNNVKGFNPKYKIISYFLTVVLNLQEMHSIFTNN